MAHTEAIEAIEVNKTVLEKRNYELNFFKLVFAVFVFFTHTNIFIGENTRFQLPLMIGPISVHFFFIVSGMLMAKSILREKNSVSDPGKRAITFVLGKYKALAAQCWTSVFMILSIYIYIYTSTDRARKISLMLAKIFPELFLVSSSGPDFRLNITWYISSMLLCMLPLSYILYKKRDFTLYIFSPLAALLLLGYIARSNSYHFIDHSTMYGVVMGGLIRGMCGLCFGIVAYLICEKIKKLNPNRKLRIVFTILEIGLWTIFFVVWFVLGDPVALFSVLLILPIAIAISFSETSYISKIFTQKWMRCFNFLSLTIYLNHFGPRILVNYMFPGQSYKFCVGMMAIFTVVACLINYAIVRLLKLLWENKLKNIFTKPDIL